MKKGVYFALATAFISGFAIFMAKIFVSKMDPIIFTTLKNIIVAIVLSILVFSKKSLKETFPKLSRKDWYKLFAIGVIGGSIPFALFFTGLGAVSAPGAAIIHKTLFIWVAFLAIVFLKEKLSLIQMIGYLLILLGTIWVSGFNRLTVWGPGEFMILVATILWSIENIIAKITLKDIPSEIVAWSRMTFGSFILLGIVVATGKTNIIFSLGVEQILAVIVGALFLTGYVLTWYKALSLAPATIVSVVLSLSMIVTASLTTLFLNGMFNGSQFTSSLFIVVGVSLVIWLALKRSKHQKQSA